MIFIKSGYFGELQALSVLWYSDITSYRPRLRCIYI